MFKAIASFSLILMSYQAQAEVYGQDFIIPRGGEMTVSQVLEGMKDKRQMKDIVVGGEISTVCQMKGCWVTLRSADQPAKISACTEAAVSAEAQKEMRVIFKGHTFSVPKDLTGDVLVRGTIKRKKLSKYQVKHFLKDMKCSEEQIKAVKKPVYKYLMQATGLKTPGEKVTSETEKVSMI